jgi:hypothetical protein
MGIQCGAKATAAPTAARRQRSVHVAAFNRRQRNIYIDGSREKKNPGSEVSPRHVQAPNAVGNAPRVRTFRNGRPRRDRGGLDQPGQQVRHAGRMPTAVRVTGRAAPNILRASLSTSTKKTERTPVAVRLNGNVAGRWAIRDATIAQNRGWGIATRRWRSAWVRPHRGQRVLFAALSRQRSRAGAFPYNCCRTARSPTGVTVNDLGLQ